MWGSALAHALFIVWLHLLPAPPEPAALSREQSERWVPRLEAQPELVWAAPAASAPVAAPVDEPAADEPVEAAPAPSEATPEPRERVKARAARAPRPEPAPEPEPEPEPAKPAEAPALPPAPAPAPAVEDASSPAEAAPAPSDGQGAPDEAAGAVASAGAQAVTAPGAAGQGGAGAGERAPKVDLGALRKGYARALFPAVRKHRVYPKTARRLGLEGRVVVAMVIDARGRVLDVKIHRPSPHAILNEAALTAMRRVQRVPAPPAGLLGARGKMRVAVPLSYTLRGGP
jgi:protein TonB